MKILVVDDEKDILKMLALEAEDFEGLELNFAHNGKEALALLEVNKYDALITDLRMPLMGGIDLLKEIRSQSIDFKTVFVASGHPKEHHAEDLNGLGPFEYIQKPYDPYAVLGKIVSEISI